MIAVGGENGGGCRIQKLPWGKCTLEKSTNKIALLISSAHLQARKRTGTFFTSPGGGGKGRSHEL